MATVLIESDKGRTLDIRVGDAVSVRLSENATTGYRWAIDQNDESLVEVTGSAPLYNSDAIGSGGEIAFDFKAKKAGAAIVVLKNWRQWEGDSSVTDRFEFKLNILP